MSQDITKSKAEQIYVQPETVQAFPFEKLTWGRF